MKESSLLRLLASAAGYALLASLTIIIATALLVGAAVAAWLILT